MVLDSQFRRLKNSADAPLFSGTSRLAAVLLGCGLLVSGAGAWGASRPVVSEVRSAPSPSPNTTLQSAPATEGDGEIDDTPYIAIVKRNPFGIRPMTLPPPPPPPPTNALPKVDVKLTGITTLLGAPRAYLMAQKPGAKGPEYYTLTEGERAEDIEVLEIDASAETVKIRQQGLEVVLNFKDNGVIARASSVPPPQGRNAASLPRPPIPTPNTTATVGAIRFPQNAPGGIIVRNGVQLAPAATVNPASVNAANIRTIPTRPIRSRDRSSP